MPELPEVETVVRELNHNIKGKIIKEIQPVYDKVFSVGSEPEILKGFKIATVKRRAKYIIFNFANSPLHLISHLRMTGEYLYNQDIEKNRFVRCIFRFTDNSLMAFADMRKFGRFDISDDLTKRFKDIGVEPLSDDLNFAYLKNVLNKSKPIKLQLLDQSIIAGIGNIYADEVLFLSKINPQRQASSISEKEIKALVKNIKLVLQKAIDDTGNILPDYREKGDKGNYYNVYGQNKKKCKICSSIIEKIILGGRGTHFCPKCQK